MVDPGDLVNEPCFQVRHRHHGGRFRIVRPLLDEVAGGRAGQQMDRPHHGPNQPLDVPAPVRLGWRAVDDLDPVLLDTSGKRLGMELLGVVEVDALRNTVDRPGDVDVPPRR